MVTPARSLLTLCAAWCCPWRLPPCRDNLVPRIQRVNHHLACYKRAGQAIFWRPKPHDPGEGWEKNDTGFLKPIWRSSPILPPSLIDLIQPSSEEESAVEEETDQEVDFREILDCDEDDWSTLTSKSFYVKSFYWKAHIPAKSMNSQTQLVHLRGKNVKYAVVYNKYMYVWANHTNIFVYGCF
mgnify:CR=1 FL=1